jgi:hypothetical protein
MASVFFDAITLADKETVQSAVIAWLFSDRCGGLTLSSRLTALEKLFGISASSFSHIDCIEAKTEWQHMDIVFELKQGGSIKYVLVMENKIKSDLHSNQLDEYVSQLKSQVILHGKGDKVKQTKAPNPYYKIPRYLGYLTLMYRGDQTVQGEIWKNVTYKNLLNSLSAALNSSMALMTDVDYQIAKSYHDSIYQMCNVTQNAMTDPSQIFTKQNTYIQTHKLGHILQKYYFENIAQSIKASCVTHLLPMSQSLDVRVSYGIQSDNAEIAIDFTSGPLVAKYLDFGPDPKDKGDFCIAFQNGTFKIAAAKNYWDKNQSDIQLLKSRGLLRNNGKDSIWDTHPSCKGWRLNPSKGEYPRMSISKSLDELGLPADWYAQPKPGDVLLQGFIMCINELLQIFPIP